jgi:hypothetical protein
LRMLIGLAVLAAWLTYFYALPARKVRRGD